MNNMVVTLTLLFLAFAPQTTALTTEWLLTWDQMGTQYIRISVAQEGAAVKATWENESFQCTLANNICEGTVTENNNPKAGKVKITMNGDEIKGEGISCFVTLVSGEKPTDELKKELQAHVAKEIGALARPDEVRFTDSLPKTRSGKIMRRLLRDIAAGAETVGDTTTLEDLSVLAKLREDEE